MTAPPDLRLDLRRTDYGDPVAAALLDLVQGEYVVRYGGRDATPVDPAEFRPPGGLFLVAWLDGRPVGCGGIRQLAEVGEDVGEIKRMYVDPTVRRAGVARRMLGALEDAARRMGWRELRLETGSRQPEAISLYEASGYQRIPGYGFYATAPGNRCFAKRLS